MSELTDALREVRSIYADEDYIERSKQLVGDQIQDLDPTVKIENTHYFNHSAIPDFVLTWPSEKRSRDLYLRGSYASIIAGNDLAELPSADTVFLALDSRTDFSEEQERITHENIRSEAMQSPRALMTDVAAVGDIGDVDADVSGPIARLVQANFVRGARGLVDDERASQMVATSPDDGRVGVTDVLRETFSEDAFLRMERTAALVDLALGEDRPEFALTGQLSPAEVEAIVPWALRRNQLSESFWSILGGLMTFEDLERIAPMLAGVNVTPLIVANAETWRVVRGYVTASDYEENPDRVTREWRFINGILGVDGEFQRLFVASSGRSLRGRNSSSLPRWDRISGPVAQFRLTSVNLLGVTRSVQIDAERSDDISGDVGRVTQSLSDDYHVADVTLRFALTDTKSDTVDLNLEFGKGLGTAPARGVTLSQMTAACLQVLSHRVPVSPADVAAILSGPGGRTRRRGR